MKLRNLIFKLKSISNTLPKQLPVDLFDLHSIFHLSKNLTYVISLFNEIQWHFCTLRPFLHTFQPIICYIESCRSQKLKNFFLCNFQTSLEFVCFLKFNPNFDWIEPIESLHECGVPYSTCVNLWHIWSCILQIWRK